MRTEELNGVTVYVCEECNMKYPEEAQAKACNDWCLEHHTCNIELIKFAIE